MLFGVEAAPGERAARGIEQAKPPALIKLILDTVLILRQQPIDKVALSVPSAAAAHTVGPHRQA